MLIYRSSIFGAMALTQPASVCVIWSLADFRRCREESGCLHYMLGRGALADPRLPHQIAEELGIREGVQPVPQSIDWPGSLQSLLTWMDRFQKGQPHRKLARLKQWLKFASLAGTFPLFDEIKRSQSVEELLNVLDGELMDVSH